MGIAHDKIIRRSIMGMILFAGNLNMDWRGVLDLECEYSFMGLSIMYHDLFNIVNPWQRMNFAIMTRLI